MRLVSFRVKNFRSIADSGDINVSRITSLLGRNESGKSNLLRALESLNPAGGFKALNPIKDFPRQRRLEECDDNTSVVESRWELNGDDQRELAVVLPRAGEVKYITIGRCYGTSRYVGFEGLSAQAFDEADVGGKIRKIVPAVKAAADKLEEAPKVNLTKAADAFEAAVAVIPDRLKWAQGAVTAFQGLRKALAAADTDISDKQEAIVASLESLASDIAGDDDAQAKARAWAVKTMPIFIYLDEYPELSGHQNITQYLERVSQSQPTDADRSFEKLCKVAGMDPKALQSLLSKGEAETRNQLANRAGAVVTTEIRRLWRDRALKVRFNLDAAYLDTLVSDPNAVYDVEVNLNERSRGFQWFFAFYITFAADTKDGDADNAILLLDEPGLYLHAKSQSDLLGHFEKDFSNQIIYTTHSPFMVPTHALDRVRTVNIEDQKGTSVTNDPTGDARTLFPLQAALGYDLAQSLFVGPSNLVVEGVTDFWILTAVSAYLLEQGRAGIGDVTVTPAGGAQKVSYMVALLTSENLNVLLLLDEEREARNTRDDLVKSKLIAEQNVVFVSEGFGTGSSKEADIEDLLDAGVYEALVRESYKAELKGKTLSLNNKVPRIAKRFEMAMEVSGIAFHKTRPARLFLKKMGTDPSSMITDASALSFETLFNAINERLAKHVARDAGAFR